MLIQKTDHDCGPTALYNALSAIGGRVPTKSQVDQALAAAALARDPTWEPTDGADHEDLKGAIAGLGFVWDEFEANRPRDAAQWLWRTTQVAPVLICTWNWGHWVTVFGPTGRRHLLQDPTTDAPNVARGGSHWLLPRTVLRRWRASRGALREHRRDLIKQGRGVAARAAGVYYGLAVYPPAP